MTTATRNLRGRMATLIAGIALLIGTFSSWADPRWSGVYYDPARDGEGFVIEVLVDHRATVYWFTYDADGNQRWFIGEGAIDAAGISVDAWLTTRGARFGDAFDPADVELVSVGNGRFELAICGAASLSYRIDDEPGSLELTLLTPVADLACGGDVASFRSGMTGSYYDPDRAGEGLVLQVYDSAAAIAFWFTYDGEGNQAWMIGDGAFDGSTLAVDLTMTRGGRFGSGFDPADVVRSVWGRLSWTSTACDAVEVVYESERADYGSGARALSRLSNLAGHSCDAGHVAELPEIVCGEAPRQSLDRVAIDEEIAMGVVDNGAFMPANACSAPTAALNGRLDFSGVAIQTSNTSTFEADRRLFPSFEVDLESVGDHVVPVQVEVLTPSNPSAWSVIVGNGRAWDEPEDGGLTRVSLPITLVHRQWNEGHNGLLTFLTDGLEISAVRFQVTQETVPWNRFNYWGWLEAEFAPMPSSGVSDTERAFRRELAERVPTASLEELPAMAMADFTRRLLPQSISQSGVLLDGVLYLDQALTRTGPYPFPDEMRHGAFSVTKTAGAAVTLLRLAQKYGDEVFDERITDWVEDTSDHGGWGDVTFEHALSMVTGIGTANPNRNQAITFSDEGNDSVEAWNVFNFARDVEQRLFGTFLFGNYPWGPGEIVRYNSSHTFVLGVAMQRYLEAREGPDADLWEMVNAEVYRPIGLRWVPAQRIRNRDRSRGVMPMGWGLYPTPHDATRIAQLLHQGGAWHGEQLLHRDRTLATLGRVGERYPTSQASQLTNGDWRQIQYRNAAWSIDVDRGPNCRGAANWMEGLGGNYVVILPTGTTLLRFADQNVYDSGSLILTGLRLDPDCAP